MLEPQWVILIALAPLATAIATTLLRGWISAQRVVGVAGMLACLTLIALFLVDSAAGRASVTQMGDWPAPFGISVVFDAFSGVMLLAANFVALCCYLHAFSSLRRRTEARWFHPLAHLLMMGVNFSFLTGDLFNLFVSFEIMLMASYALLILGGSRRVMAHAHKYVMLNLIGSTFFVLGAGLVYGMMGTLNYADLARLVAESALPGGTPVPAGFHAVAIMLLFVFALKAAIFPLWFWLPDTYPTCPVAIGALFSGLLTKVGVYAVCRLYPMIFAAEPVRAESPAMTILWIAAIFTMLAPIVAAVAMNSLRRLLALTLVSHIGYLVMGVAIMSPAALSGVIFYMAQHMVVMAGLFLCCGLVERIGGTDDLRQLGGLQRRAPWLSAMFFILALSLAGVPPLSGFFGKLLIIREGFAAWESGGAILAVAALATSLLTLLALGKAWILAFWSPAHTSPPAFARESSSAGPLGDAPLAAQQRSTGWAQLATALIVVAALAVAIAAEPGMGATNVAAAQLDDPRAYVGAVLGPEAWPSPSPGIMAAADAPPTTALPSMEAAP